MVPEPDLGNSDCAEMPPDFDEPELDDSGDGGVARADKGGGAPQGDDGVDHHDSRTTRATTTMIKRRSTAAQGSTAMMMGKSVHLLASWARRATNTYSIFVCLRRSRTYIHTSGPCQMIHVLSCIIMYH